MKQRILPLLSGLLLLGSFCYGQGSIFTNLGSDLKRADRLYERLAYAPAAELYQTVLGRSKKNQDDVKIKLGRCYYRLNQPKQSAYWYGQVLADSAMSQQDQVFFAQSLSGSQQYEQALARYRRMDAQLWGEEVGAQSWVEKKVAGLENIAQFYEDSAYYQVEPLSINTTMAEFSPMFYQDGLLFVSSRTQRKPVKRVYRWDQTPFLDLYYVPVDSSGATDTPQSLSTAVNTKLHEGSVAFLDNGKRMVFTRNSLLEGREKLSDEKVNKLNLYTAERADENAPWENITPLPFNSPEYSTGHPAVSSDGQTVYFVSDMPGGIGGTDLYTVSYKNGQWGEPQNLGDSVNTVRDEMFPFAHEDGTLYFASSGHAGLGGLDVFRSTAGSEPINMGYPINTHRDDFGLIVDSTGTMGYFASNRANGGVDDDLYQVAIDRPEELLVIGRVTDQGDQQALTGAKAVLKSLDGQPIAEAVTDEEGNYQLEAPLGEVYTLTTTKDDYTSSRQEIDATQPSKDALRVENELAKERIVARGQVTDVGTGGSADSAIVRLINRDTGETEKEVVVDESGNYEFVLSPDQRYELQAEKQDYFGSLDSINTSGMRGETIIRDIALNKVELNESINLEIIYYDFDKAFIRESAEPELDRLVTFMKSHPSYEVELGSHTDARGDDAYNMDLSQRRSESAVEYIIGKGIDRERITAKGYGESQVMNGCTNEVDCSVFQHQKNRRTEFKVVKQ